MNIDEIRSEKEKLQIVIDEAIENFKSKTGCNVSIKTMYKKTEYQMPYGRLIVHDELKIHIDVIIN